LKPYLVADLFCGAGGSSTGAERAVKSLGAKMILVCVNHWPLAIETHRKNHPTARHYIEDLSVAKPAVIVPEGYLDLLMASPECTHFSRARGGKPVNDQSRMNPWAVIRWMTDLDVRCLLVENVPEFIQWGPLDKEGHPIPERKGDYFEAWIRTIWELGYQLEWRFLNAADFGDATTRRRFFLIARKDGVPVRWPEPSHAGPGAGEMVGARLRWKAAREIIDWDNAGRSLLDDPKYLKRPLSINTRRRIARGLEKYGGRFAPLYINLLGLEAAMDGGGLLKVEPVAEPFILGQQSCSAARSAGEPIPTVATDGAISLVDPQLVIYHGTSNTRTVDKPIPCQPTKSKIGLVKPQLVKYYGTKRNTVPVDIPLDTITTKDRFGLVEPTAEAFIVQSRLYYGHKGDPTRAPHSINNPVATITGHGGGEIVQPVIIQTDQTGGNGDYAYSADQPLKTIITKQNIGIAEPVLMDAAGGRIDPRRLVLVDGKPYILDIRFRMLTNRELARAMGFDDQETEYEFLGTIAEVTKQIGNAVPVNLAAALVKSIFEVVK
jgi:DNA (cytosine-5)-methyltransferase 1